MELLADLKSQADLLGIKYSGNIGYDALKAKVDAFKTENNDPDVGVVETTPDEDLGMTAKERKRQALMMIKVRVTNLNAQESDESNVYKGVITKDLRVARYIPFDTEWYVEQCLIDALQEAQVQVFVNEIDPVTKKPNGNKVPKLVKHYNIQY